MKKLACIIIFSVLYLGLRSDNYTEIVNLEGNWKFSVGDNPAWSFPDLDDSKWDLIRVPGAWESRGYEGYDGYAWYRKSFYLGKLSTQGKIVLILGNIDDVDEVYVNGKKTGSSGQPFPDFHTAYMDQRKYVIPWEILNEDGINHIAVRVYDAFLDGGIINGPIGLYTDRSTALLDLDLSGKWRFKTIGDYEHSTDDSGNSEWRNIRVPASWESQGYEGYDGKAVYMLNFTMPLKLKGEKLYLILGRIDDIEQVLFNDHVIGTYTDFTRDPDRAYDKFRYYAIPSDIIDFASFNRIIVMVEDFRGPGGIVEGPVGICQEENIGRIRSYNESERTFWDYIFD